MQFFVFVELSMNAETMQTFLSRHGPTFDLVFVYLKKNLEEELRLTLRDYCVLDHKAPKLQRVLLMIVKELKKP